MEIQPSKPKIIAFSGTHGTGKSTSCYEKAYYSELGINLIYHKKE
jgi:broad-specificity NMP kinase